MRRYNERTCRVVEGQFHQASMFVGIRLVVACTNEIAHGIE